MSGKLAARARARARKAWRYVDHDEAEPKVEREPQLDPIGLHECRHTYASLLVAAGYNLKEVMEPRARGPHDDEPLRQAPASAR